ncbi:MAG: cytochrome P460 family protein [Pseudomonadota bacterium]
MKPNRLAATALAATALAVAAGAAELEDRSLALPADYRTAFDNYLISDRVGQEDQVISLYANAIAREAARADGTLPSGSVIVGEIYAARMDADGAVVESALGRRIPETLKAIVVMERRTGWGDQYPEGEKVGGWEFEVFSPAGENLNKDTTACRACHEPLTDSEYTFSYEHIAAAN